MYGGMPDRGNAASGSIRPPLERIWQYNAQGGILGSPLVRDSVMILGTLHGEIQAVDLSNGKRLGYKVLGSAVVGTPVLDGSLVIVTLAGKQETLLAYDLRDGKPSWVFPSGSIESSPLVVDEFVYVTTLEGLVYCVQKRTGDEVWKFEMDQADSSPLRSSPASDGSILVFGSDGGMLIALDRSSGTLKWKVETGASIFSTPVISSGIVVVGNLKGVVYGVDAHSGAIRWEFNTGSKVYSPAAASGTSVFVGSADGILHALDIRTGKQLWKFSAKSVINSAPLVTGSLLYVGSLDRTLYCLDRSSGEEVWTFKADGRIKVPPVLWGDILLVTSEDKYVTALRPRESL